MTENRITMGKLLEILRMRFGSQLSFRQISRSVRVSVGTVSNYVKAFQESDLGWSLAEDMSEPELIQALFPDAPIANRKGLIDPDWAEVHQDLKRKEVTKQRLWEEYCQAHPLNAYSYAQYCHRYNQWRGCQKRSMRQLHNAGEKLCLIVRSNQKSLQKKPLPSLRKRIGQRLPSLKNNIRQPLPNLKKSIKRHYLPVRRKSKSLSPIMPTYSICYLVGPQRRKSKSKQGDQKQQSQSKNTTRQSSNRNCGHQPEIPGHGRRKHEILPVEDVELDLLQNGQYCATCQLPFKLHPGTDECDVIEIEVKPHIRRYHRKRYRKTCS